MEINNLKITPFIKWAGGKNIIIQKYLHKYIPKNFNKYLEPFLGGGAVLFYLQPKKAIINDINKELMTCYLAIKKNAKLLIKLLDKKTLLHSEKFYYLERTKKYRSIYQIAAQFIYLNKTGFNGLYRVNAQNQFNVPWNQKMSVALYKKDNLNNISFFLNNKNIEITNTDFENIINKSNNSDFIFCDPPYDYENTKGFVAYTSKGFGRNEQIKLYESLKLADARGSKWMLTNHDTTFINELYKNYNIIPITTNRNINSLGSNRKNAGKEVVIINYEY